MLLARHWRVLSLLDNLVVIASARDVTAAYCLARAEVRVRFPLGAPFDLGLRILDFGFGVWESLEIRVLREHESVGSNPTAPTFVDSARWLADRLEIPYHTATQFLRVC